MFNRRQRYEATTETQTKCWTNGAIRVLKNGNGLVFCKKSQGVVSKVKIFVFAYPPPTPKGEYIS